MKRCLLVLALFLSFQSTVHAERVNGPADLRDKPEGKTIVSLHDDVDVDGIALRDDWYIVRVAAFIAKNDLAGQDRINKKAILYDSKNKEIGKTLDTVEIDKMSGIREGKELSSVNVVAYLHKKYFLKAPNKPLVIEEYKLPAKNIHDLPRKNKCSDLAECLPAEILKKRKAWRSTAPTFQQDRLDDKTLGVGRVKASTAKNIRKDLAVPRLVLEIQLGERTLYSFQTIEDTFYREIHQLYAHDGHWILEYKQRDAAHEHSTTYSGVVMVDGVNLNTKNNLQEMFYYGYINGKPFYFLRSSTKFGGISYDGLVLPLDYDEIQHYLCCADSGFNPRVYKDMIGFFATKNGSLYYVEAGVY